MRHPAYSHRDRHIDEGFFELKAKPGHGLCMVKGCRNHYGKVKFSLCHKHYQYRWRMLNPKRSSFAALRDRAKDRGIEFTISYDYWLGLTDAYRYFPHDAVSFKECLSIDRVDASKGYVPGNLAIITVSENSKKSHKEKFLPAHVQAILDRKRAKIQGEVQTFKERDPDDFPF